MTNEKDLDDFVDRLVKSKNFKYNLKKIPSENSSALDGLSNKKEKFAATKLWFEKLPLYESARAQSQIKICAEYVADHRKEDDYYNLRNIKLIFKEHDHFNLIRNLMEHYICRVCDATHPLQIIDWDPYYEAFCRSRPIKIKGKFTQRQYESFYYMAEVLEETRKSIVKEVNGQPIVVNKKAKLKPLELSQFDQDLLLEMIEHYLNLPDEQWFASGERTIMDTKYELEYLHELIENL